MKATSNLELLFYLYDILSKTALLPSENQQLFHHNCKSCIILKHLSSEIPSCRFSVSVVKRITESLVLEIEICSKKKIKHFCLIFLN